MHYAVKGALPALLLVLAAGSASSAVWYVDQNAPPGTRDGKTWQTAFPGIGTAMSPASNGDEIWVAAGTYLDPISLKAGIGLYGGFVGTEIFRDQRPSLPGLTKIGPGDVLSFSTGCGRNTVLDGFTLAGRAIYISSGSSPSITHNVFRSIGLSLISSNALVADNTFLGTGQKDGGAIRCAEGSPAIVNNTIVGSSSGNSAAGIVVFGGSATIVNNIVAFNQSGVMMSGGYRGSYLNNCVYGNAAGNYVNTNDLTGRSGNISVDPKLASVEYGNMHIQPDSPCRDAGDDSVVSPGDTDLDFQARILGAHVDIGADESDGRALRVVPRIVRVSPTGNDRYDGTSWTLARKSLQPAVDLAANEGGEVWVAGGTHILPVGGTPPGGVKIPANVWLYGGFAGNETARGQRDWLKNPTILDGKNETALITFTSGFRVSAIDGFVLRNGFMSPSYGGQGVIMSSGGFAGPFIANNLVMRSTGVSVAVQGGAPVITGNGFVDNAGAVIVAGGPATVIARNVFRGNTGGTCVSLSTPGGVRVADNLFFANNAGSATTANVVSVAAGSAAPAVITGNTFVSNAGAAVRMTSDCALSGNVFAMNDVGINLTTLGNPSLLRNNCLYLNKQDYLPAQSPRPGDIYAWPGFADFPKGDLRLAAGSPCIDAGDDAVVRPGDLDLDGHPRILGAHVDIGCYEFGDVKPRVTWLDVVQALRAAGGLDAAQSGISDLSLAETLARRLER